MKPNPTRNWAIQFWGENDEHYSTIILGTYETALREADEHECEIDWQVLRVSIAAVGTPASS